MAYPTDCPGCVVGNHGCHDPNHGIMPGLIGGTSCDCPGDCAERFNAAMERTRGLFATLPAPAPTEPTERTAP